MNRQGFLEWRHGSPEDGLENRNVDNVGNVTNLNVKTYPEKDDITGHDHLE